MVKREHIPAKLRHEVFKRDNYRCRECGATNKETTLEIDHIVPVSKGGSNNLNNLQTLCKKCNRSKHTRTWVGGITDNNLQNLHPKLGKLSDEVLRELNTGFYENIFTILNKLEYAVKQYEKYQNCKFIELTVHSEVIDNPYNQIIARFHKKGKYVNILLELRYFGGTSFDFLIIGKKIYDDRLLMFPEYVKLIEDVTNKGFEYKGINPIYLDSINYISEISSYFIETHDWVVLTFERDGFYYKNYKFNIKSRTYEIMPDNYDLSKLFDKNNRSTEKKLLLKEIQNIEDRYNCKFEECGESKLLFNINNKEKLICNYDLETHKLSKKVQCSNSEFEFDYGMRYGFVPPDYF